MRCWPRSPSWPTSARLRLPLDHGAAEPDATRLERQTGQPQASVLPHGRLLLPPAGHRAALVHEVTVIAFASNQTWSSDALEIGH